MAADSPESPMGWGKRPVKVGRTTVGFLDRAWEAECPFKRYLDGRSCGVIVHAGTKGSAARQLREHWQEVHRA